MSSCYDLVVIGAGSGGLAAAKRAASHGARVAIVEEDRVGGTCVIRGCVPKKLLVFGSLVHEQLLDAPSYGWRVPASACDQALLLQKVRAEVDRLNWLHIDLLAKAGVDLIRGRARFSGPRSVSVQPCDNGKGGRELEATRILIAAGGRPCRPAIPGAALAWVSDDMFLQERFPERVVIVGAGFIACEFAGILTGLGVKVNQLVRGDHLLKGFDREATDMVLEGMESHGVDVRLAHIPAAIEGEPGALTVVTEGGERLPCGGVLLATGRRPVLATLNLEAAGVAVEGHRIPVTADQVTNVPHVYAVGDVTDRVNLTPVAIDEGRAFADTVYGGQPRQVDHDLVASAVFSQPELAGVGLTQERAAERYGPEGVRVVRARFRSLAQALPKRGSRCLLKLVLRREDERVLGCHMVGEHAAEIIQMAGIALGMGARKADFDRTMALHPTVSEEFVTMP